MPFWTAKPKPGDGAPLEPMSGLQFMWRTVFEVDHANHRYAIDTNLFDLDGTIHLYEDGRRIQSREAPARFDIAGGKIKVDVGVYGLTRAHLVPLHGRPQMMAPAPGTAERWRLELASRRPALSAVLSWTSWSILVIALLLQLPQWAAWLLPLFDIEFSSPISLPGWLNIGITIAGGVAALDRALQVKNHWLLDSDLL